VGHEALAQRAEHFDSSVRFGLDEPDAMQRLHAVTKDLRAVAELDALLPKVLEGTLSLTGADFGTVQIFDPATRSLKIVTQAGFGSEFLEYFAVVDDDASACGRAAQEGAQVVIVDVNADAGFARHRDIAASAGFRAVQSTPLVDYAGRLIGMVSTHFRPPHRPSDRDLRVMELYGDFAGEAVRQRLGASARPDASAPVGQAVVSALLDHDDGPNGNVSVPFELWLMGRMTASLARRTRPASRRTT
jgi:GAF domain